MHIIVVGTIAIFLYLLASVLLGKRLRDRDTRPLSKWKGLITAAFATSLHGWVLAQFIFTGAGLNMGVYNALSLVTWLISIILIISSIKRPLENIGIIAFPATALAIALENSLTANQVTATLHTPIEIHILLSIGATSLFSIAAVQAILLTIQDHHLRSKRPGGFIRALPPLQAMERLLFQLIGIGFVLQSFSLLSGFIFLDNMFAQHMVHKSVLSVIAWGVFAVLLWGRWKFGWRGKKAIRWTHTGFGVLLLAYIGSKLVLEVILK